MRRSRWRSAVHRHRLRHRGPGGAPGGQPGDLRAHRPARGARCAHHRAVPRGPRARRASASSCSSASAANPRGDGVPMVRPVAHRVGQRRPAVRSLTCSGDRSARRRTRRSPGPARDRAGAPRGPSLRPPQHARAALRRDPQRVHRGRQGLARRLQHRLLARPAAQERRRAPVGGGAARSSSSGCSTPAPGFSGSLSGTSRSTSSPTCAVRDGDADALARRGRATIRRPRPPACRARHRRPDTARGG